MNDYALTAQVVIAGGLLLVLLVCCGFLLARLLDAVQAMRPEWRELLPGEYIREGDECLIAGKWEKSSRVGLVVYTMEPPLRYRRRVEGRKS